MSDRDISHCFPFPFRQQRYVVVHTHLFFISLVFRTRGAGLCREMAMKKTRGLPKANKPRASTKKINIDLKKHDVRVKKMPPVVNKQKYLLSLRHQLIDLNKSFKNFKLQFQVVSSIENKEFHAVVLNQEQLDTISDLNSVEMKMAKGRIGGTIVADNNKYQNYFLILRAVSEEDATEVEVTTSLEEIEPKQVATASSNTERDISQNTAVAGDSTIPSPSLASISTTTSTNSDTSSANYGYSWRRALRSPFFWFVMIVLIALLAYAFYTYYYLPKTTVISTPERLNLPTISVPKEMTATASETRDVRASSSAPSDVNGSGALYSKLKQIS